MINKRKEEKIMEDIKKVVQFHKLLSYFLLIATIWTGTIEVAIMVIPCVIVNQLYAALLSIGEE